MSEEKTWHGFELAEGAELLKKEWFDYNNEKGQYQIELFETITGKFFAIGTPKDPDEQMVIYGSSVVDDKYLALRITIDKIEREGLL